MLSGVRSVGRPLRQLLYGLHVLVVDDDDDVRASLVTTLEYLGAAVTATGSADDARRALGSLRPDAILSDLAMPHEDGFAFVASLRVDAPQDRWIPAAALTAHDSVDTRERALRSGYAKVVPKPFGMLDIARVVLDLCGR